MEDFAEKHFNVEFSNNVTFTMRQTPGFAKMLAGSTADYTGNTKARIQNKFGRLRMQPKNGRNSDTDNTDISSTVRFIKPNPMGTVAPLVDIEDQQETSLDLGSPIVKEVAEAAEVYHDDMFFKGFFGNAYAGEGGDDLVGFKQTNVVPHGGTGLTKEKLLATRELLRARNAPFGREMPVILLQPEDETDLFLIDEYASFDYNGGKPLADGEVKPWLGFRFMAINPDEDSLPTSFANFFADAGATRQLPVIFPSGMHRGVWTEFMGYVDRRPDKNQSEQFWGAARSSAARLDEDLAFIIQTQ